MEYGRENKKYEIAVIVVCILILMPLFCISVYNRASGDDYDYSIITHRVIEEGGNVFQLIKAAWDTTVHFYNTWQGLYTSAFLLALQPGIFGEVYYGLGMPIIIGIAYLCLFFSLSILNKHFIGYSRLFTVSTALLILTILMLWLPSVNEGLFWFNGAMNYTPFVFLNFLNLSIITEIYYNKNHVKQRILLIVSTSLSFLISGGNHVTAFANILLLLIAIGFLCKRKRYYVIFPFLSAVIGFVIMYTAPGTAIRQSAFEPRGVIETIFATIKQVRLVAGEWISFQWIISMFLITPIVVDVVRKNKEKFSEHFPILPILLAAMVICGMFCVPYLPTGGFGEGRVTNVIWITFMLLSMILYILILGYLAARGYVNIDKVMDTDKKGEIIKSIVVLGGLVLLFGSVDGLKTSTSFSALDELKNGTAQAYCKQMDERIERYQDDALEIVSVPPIKTKSPILFHTDLEIDPYLWPNTSIGMYYGKLIHVVYY